MYTEMSRVNYQLAVALECVRIDSLQWTFELKYNYSVRIGRRNEA